MFKKRKLYHDYRNREERESVSRSRLLTHPLLGRLSLRNQLGKAARRPLPLNPAEDVAAYYAASLSQRPIYNSFVAIPAFVVDETNGAIILAHAHPGSGNDTLHCLRPLQAGRYGDTPHVFEALPNSIGDMVISPQHKKLLYTCSNERRMLAVLLDVPAEKDDPHHGRIEEVWDFIDETGWQLAVAPDTGACFAIASSGGLRHMRMRPEQTEITSVVGVQGQTRHEYTAAAFGINDRTLMGGKRSGVVTIHDERTHESVRRLSHADGVSVIRMVDEDRVLVRGLTKVCSQSLVYLSHPVTTR